MERGFRSVRPARVMTYLGRFFCTTGHREGVSSLEPDSKRRARLTAKCQYPDCTTVCTFGRDGDKHASYCAVHKQEGASSTKASSSLLIFFSILCVCGVCVVVVVFVSSNIMIAHRFRVPVVTNQSHIVLRGQKRTKQPYQKKRTAQVKHIIDAAHPWILLFCRD